jgi:shikimate dehydrogenase
MNELADASDISRPRVTWPDASTKSAGLVGSPVSHSLSPTLHNAAFRAMGLDWCYLAFEVQAGALDKAVAGALALGLRGLSVTMPHKDAAARLANRHSRQVRRLGAANTLVFEAGTVLAENYDGEGLLDDLKQGAGFDPVGRRCGVIGAGGAGRAAVLALADGGAREIVIVNRSTAPAWRSAALAPKVARVGRAEEIRGMDLVIQATPVEMAHDAPDVEAEPANGQVLVTSSFPGDGGACVEAEFHAIDGVEPSWFSHGQLVVDLVYDPPLTPFLIEASRGGAAVRNGMGMLVHQAARQIKAWTGAEPPLQVMWEAVGPGRSDPSRSSFPQPAGSGANGADQGEVGSLS